MDKDLIISRGYPLPLGTSHYNKGINFSLFSKHALTISLCLFKTGEESPYREIVLDPKLHRTGDIWHICIENIPYHDLYGYRIDGPYEPYRGLFFDNRNILLDPYAKQVDSSLEWGSGLKNTIQKGIIYPTSSFDWEGDEHPNIPLKDLIIYEMHVRGFTKDPSSKVQNPGTFLGVIEKIPHLKSLGINAIELMPIFEFNENENLNLHPKTGEPLHQYWGYSTINFFSPMGRFGSGKVPLLIDEFKMLVKELHANGIEVILDVVFNHTAEGNHEGPIISFKGIENSTYYMMTPNNEYYNFTGCGNTFNCNNPIVIDLIRDSLRYWVCEMHVDGFRFDLASILTRGPDGAPLPRPPVIEALSLDPVLANTKLIAEAWDAAGLYQVGSFPGFGVWAEWNGKYRDTVRKFLKGTDGESGNFATRLSGSEDLYGWGRSPSNSINFITAHDGFTLKDLVSYNGKHNDDNGEGNRDGANDNESWNCGVEGETDDKGILQLRQQQMKNHTLALMVSQGVPMILMGDEYGHTKLGNNNTWCHDSAINWFQWDELEKNEDLFRFFRMIIAFRKSHPVLSRSRFLKDKDIIWHGREPMKADWGPLNRFLSFTLPDKINHYELYIAFNASFQPVNIHLPKKDKKYPWLRLVDTSKQSPEDFLEEKAAPCLVKPHYQLPSYSALVLKSYTS